MSNPFLEQDVHTHTELAPCAEDVTLDAAVAKARELGIRLFAVTEHSRHLYAPMEGPPEGGRAAFLVPGFLDRQRNAGQWRVPDYFRLAAPYRSESVWVGMEVDVAFDGSLLLHEDVLARLDIVVGAVHLVPERVSADPDQEEVTRQFVEITCKALEQGIDVLAHPTRILKHTNVPVTTRATIPVLDAARANGVAVEINQHSLDPDAEFVRGALERGIPLAIGSDAHRMDEVGNFTFARKVLAEAGVDVEDLDAYLYRPERRRALHPAGYDLA